MNAVPENRKLPPMLKQYQEYKKKHSDCILLFQVGDFYEAFFQDAITISNVLNITLTSRDKNSPDPIPMAGVPIAVVDGYMERLVNAGFSVALVSQCEPPSGKGMVARKLERIVTPGIRLLGEEQEAAVETIVAALGLKWRTTDRYRDRPELALAYSDVQTGEIFVREGISLAALPGELRRITPRELVLPREVEGRQIDRRLSWVREIEFLLGEAAIRFRSDLSLAGGQARNYSTLQGYSALGPTAKKASRLLVEYIDEITVDTTMPISSISVKSYADVLILDATTRTNLELVRNLKDGGKDGTLFQIMDYTRTGAGERLLRQWILNPLKDLKKIGIRAGAVEALLHCRSEREKIQEVLRYMTDFERIAARIELGIVSPRELGALRNAYEAFPEISKQLDQIVSSIESQRLSEQKDNISVPGSLFNILNSALVDNPPPGINDGGIIRDRYHEDLDHLREVKNRGKTWILELEKKERELTGIPSLKIKFNNVHGYFLEVTKAHLEKVPDRYLRKQTMTNAERYFTTELKELEEEVLGAGDKQKILERELFIELRKQMVPFTAGIRSVGREISELDLFLSLAELADREGFVRPELNDSSRLLIKAGKHPVVARQLKGGFVPNPLAFEDDGCNCHIITGANMGGKSTYLRQVGLIVIMAQMGSFVPAEEAQIGLVDKVFARIGASDDLLEGESTFMVEMREAANIVSNATEKSLLLIDEIGRGTATSDGLAIAQAILEWIVLRIKCRTLFATHFHELTVLEEKYSAIANYSVGSVDEGDTVVFTHEICRGAANKSYGLEVAGLAGLPPALVQRARELLRELDVDDLIRAASSGSSGDSQLSMFSGIQATGSKKGGEAENLWERLEVTQPADYQKLKELSESLEGLDVDLVTPLEALNLLSSLKSSLGEGDPE